MKHLPKAKTLLLPLAVYGLLFAFLQIRNAYHYYFVEQNQLFQNTLPYVAEHLWQPGGLARLASEFLTQFFLLPYAGAGITAALLVGVGWVVGGAMRRIAPRGNLALLCWLPAMMLMFAHFDFNYPALGTVAFLMAGSVFYLVLGVGDPRRRLAGHFLAVPLLFFLAGPVFLLYALWAMIASCTQGTHRTHRTLKGKDKGKDKEVLFLLLLWGGIPGETMLMGLLSVSLASFGEYRHVFLPDGYYHLSLFPRSAIYFSWIASLLLLLWACFLRRRREKGGKERRRWPGMVAQGVLLAALCLWGLPKYDDRQSYLMKELDYYCRTEQWDRIPERCRGTLTNYLYISYLNLALLQKGELGDRMFAYDQRGPQGLLVDWNKTASVSILLNDIYFAVNATALSQEMAFEAYLASMGEGNPRALKRLVQTNLIYGAYPVAEKYISILEHTFCYREWARAHRRFLYNDAEVAKDSLLGNKRRSLMPSASLSLIDGLEAELQGIAACNPSDPSAITYSGCFYLLEKNLEGFRAFLETYYATPVLPSLAVAFQEAVIILSEQDPDCLQRFEVSEAVIRRFADYKRQVVEGNRSGNAQALPSLMRRSFGDTYWFYFMFK
ncbi:MAG: DUF6057 family protein [Tannerellaceae bacterium]|jgi:hypothetical protein|nr:DUF6057 family protein [Tannerellaceae bacterium]